MSQWAYTDQSKESIARLLADGAMSLSSPSIYNPGTLGDFCTWRNGLPMPLVA